MTQFMLELTGKALPSDWHSWRIQKWGTKWDAPTEMLFERTEEGLFYDFDTAWSPPTPWLKAASKAYPELKFDMKYCECGNDFSGQVVFEKGLPVVQKDGRASDMHPEENFENYF